MLLKELREAVLEANLELVRRGLVLYTFGNASGVDRERGLVVIKPSGVEYGELRPGDMVVTDLDGKIVDGTLKPSSDLDTHTLLYREFAGIGGVVHTHLSLIHISHLDVYKRQLLRRGWATQGVWHPGLRFGGAFQVLGFDGGDAVGDGDLAGGDGELRGFEAVAFGRDGDGAGGEGGAHRDAVDAEFGGEVELSLIHI